MKNRLLFVSMLFVTAHVSGQVPQLGKSPIKEVIEAMTLDEKIDLLVGSRGNEESSMKATVGNYSNIVPGAAGQINGIPRLGIPCIVLGDGPAGLRIQPTRERTDKTYYCTHFPVETVMGSTWNTELVYNIGKAMGNEVKEYGVDVLLAPATNIHRNPLNGRNFEYYSEDPLLSGKMAAAMINGLQSNGIGTSLKHFALNNQETNRTNNDVIGSPRTFREIYLKPFEIAVKESKPWTVMSSYNKINGYYACERADLLTEILRHEWGFKGMVMTDWYGGQNVTNQMNAGNDLLMPGKKTQRDELRKAVLNGQLSLEIIDRNIQNILECIMKTPRFNDYKYNDAPDLVSHAAITRRAALEGMVLLKNVRSVLPLNKKVNKIAVFGRSSYDFIAGGTGSGDVYHAYVVSLLDGLKNSGYLVDPHMKEVYDKYIIEAKAKMPQPTGRFAKFLNNKLIPEMEISSSDLNASVENNDLAIITIGKNSGEFADRYIKGNLTLTEPELKMIRDVTTSFHRKGKKVIVIMNVCGVVETQNWIDQPDAVLLSWLPGQEGGNSIADILMGKESPSGRLPMTWPVSYNDVPSKDDFPTPDEISEEELIKSLSGFEDSRSKGDKKNYDYTQYHDGIYVGYRYYTTNHIKVSYPFGFGLSYTSFKYDAPVVRQLENGDVKIEVKVKNQGRYSGKEVVQVYVTAPRKDMDKPLRELKGFAKTKELKPGESQIVEISIPFQGLASFNETESCWQVESGEYQFLIAKNADDAKPLVSTVTIEGKITEKVRPCLGLEKK